MLPREITACGRNKNLVDEANGMINALEICVSKTFYGIRLFLPVIAFAIVIFKFFYTAIKNPIPVHFIGIVYDLFHFLFPLDYPFAVYPHTYVSVVVLIGF